MADAGAQGSRARAAARSRTSTRALELRDAVRRGSAAAVGVALELMSLADLDHERVQHRGRGPRPRPGGRGDHDRRRALRPARRARRLAGAGAGRSGPGAGAQSALDVLLREVTPAHAPVRALARLLDDRQPLSGRGAEGGDRSAGAGGQSPVGRRARARCDRVRLLRVLLPEVARAVPTRPAVSSFSTRTRSRWPRRATSRSRPTSRPVRSRRATAPPASTRTGRPCRRWPVSPAALELKPEAASSARRKMAARCRDLLGERVS